MHTNTSGGLLVKRNIGSRKDNTLYFIESTQLQPFKSSTLSTIRSKQQKGKGRHAQFRSSVYPSATSRSVLSCCLQQSDSNSYMRHGLTT